MDNPSGQLLDGYRLIRLLGRGGFGEVWLCRSEAVGDLRAIKLIPTASGEKLERERAALTRFRAAAGLHSPHLVPIEHVNLTPEAFFYVMPLADGIGGCPPEDAGWTPRTLETAVESRRVEGGWFSSEELVAWIRPVLLALQALLDARLVHGDVKPSNILFFSGATRLGDIGLLGDDSLSVTRRGTPGFAAPSWYRGGLPDMYGAAATLYHLLTSHPPDTMGRSAFLWPPQGEAAMGEAERREWGRLHAVVRRAVEERPSERYRDFAAMLAAVEGRRQSRLALRVAAPATALVLACGGVALAVGMRGETGGGPPQVEEPPAESPATVPELTEEERRDYSILSGMVAAYDADGDSVRALAMVDSLLSEYPHSRTQPVYSLYRAKSLSNLGRDEEAREELRKAVHVSPRIEAMPVRIDLWESLGDLEEAELSQSRIIEAYGPNTLALAFRAEVRAKRGDYPGVEADRLAALPLNPADPETQRRLVETLWDGIAKKQAGYADYLAGLGNEPGPPEPADEGASSAETWVEEVYDEVLAALKHEGGAALSEQAAEAQRVLCRRLADDCRRGHYEYPLVMLDRLTLPEIGPGGRQIRSLRVKTPALSLLRAYLLDRLGRFEEAEQELSSPVHGDTGTRDVEARVALLVALRRHEEAEELLGRIFDSLPPGEASDGEERTALLGVRARLRAESGRHAEVRADYETALALAAEADPPESGEGAATALRHVEETWRRLEDLYPDYAAYLEEP